MKKKMMIMGGALVLVLSFQGCVGTMMHLANWSEVSKPKGSIKVHKDGGWTKSYRDGRKFVYDKNGKLIFPVYP